MLAPCAESDAEHAQPDATQPTLELIRQVDVRPGLRCKIMPRAMHEETRDASGKRAANNNNNTQIPESDRLGWVVTRPKKHVFFCSCSVRRFGTRECAPTRVRMHLNQAGLSEIHSNRAS